VDSAVERLRAVYVNWAEGDFWADGDIWHEDIELVFADSFLDASSHRGLEGLPDAFKVWLRAWDHWEAELEELHVIPGRRIVALCVFRGFGAKGGTPVVSEGAHIWTFAEDGLVSRMEIHRTRDVAMELLGSAP
jgi:hypothetical protein